MDPQRFKPKVLDRENRNDGQSDCHIEVRSRGAQKWGEFLPAGRHGLAVEKPDRSHTGKESKPVCDKNEKEKCGNQREKLLNVTAHDRGKKIV